MNRESRFRLAPRSRSRKNPANFGMHRARASCRALRESGGIHSRYKLVSTNNLEIESTRAPTNKNKPNRTDDLRLSGRDAGGEDRSSSKRTEREKREWVRKHASGETRRSQNCVNLPDPVR